MSFSIVPLIPLSPSVDDLNAPFYRPLRQPSKTLALDVEEALTPAERQNAEKFLKEVEEYHRQQFTEAAFRRRYAYVFRAEVKIRKPAN